MYEFYRGTMIIGCCFICVFAVLINKVSLQVPVEGVTGGSVVLPCSSTEHDLKLQDTDVHWRHNGSENVYDLIKGTDSVERQDPRYKNRVKTLPLEYKGGIFSINLTHLTHGDAGNYICLITDSSEFQTVQLIIKEKSTAEKESKSAEQENHPEETESDNVDTSLNSVYIVLIVLLLIIVFIVVFIALYCRKKFKAPIFSSVST